jgi:hypothetical protein
LADGIDFGATSDFAATEASACDATTCGFGVRCRLASGLACRATLSHNARSSSLRLRLRRGGLGKSGVDGGRFIGGDND